MGVVQGVHDSWQCGALGKTGAIRVLYQIKEMAQLANLFKTGDHSDLALLVWNKSYNKQLSWL